MSRPKKPESATSAVPFNLRDPERGRRAAESQETRLAAGGERVFVVLPEQPAKAFRRYVKRFGGKKAALEALIEFAETSKL